MSLNVVCPNCFSINRIPQKEHYTKANCGKCKHSLLNSEPIDVDEKGLERFIQNSDLPVIVDFWAPWCGPCQMMAPAFKEASRTLPLKAQFLKLNTQDHPHIGTRYAIQGIPTMIRFQNGVETKRISGALSKDQIVQWVMT